MLSVDNCMCPALHTCYKRKLIIEPLPSVTITLNPYLSTVRFMLQAQNCRVAMTFPVLTVKEIFKPHA